MCHSPPEPERALFPTKDVWPSTVSMASEKGSNPYMAPASAAVARNRKRVTYWMRGVIFFTKAILNTQAFKQPMVSSPSRGKYHEDDINVSNDDGCSRYMEGRTTAAPLTTQGTMTPSEHGKHGSSYA